MTEYEEGMILPPKLGEAEEAELWRKFTEERDMDARSRLIENYLQNVIDIAENWSKKIPHHVDVQDLISYGNLGLLDAVGKFDPKQNVKFSTYCQRRISGAIIDELRRLDWPSRQLRQKANMVHRKRTELENRNGRVATDDELQQELGLDNKQFNELMSEIQIKSMVSLDRKWDDNDDNEIGPIEMLPDSKATNPLDELTRREIKEVAMRGLSDDAKKVLILYYYENLNLKEIGRVLELSESRVCQIHQQALAFLKQAFIQREITPYTI